MAETCWKSPITTSQIHRGRPQNNCSVWKAVNLYIREAGTWECLAFLLVDLLLNFLLIDRTVNQLIASALQSSKSHWYTPNKHTHTHTYHSLHIHTLIHHIFSCVARRLKSELCPVCQSEALKPINTASEANTQNTDRGARLLFQGTWGGGGVDTSISMWYISPYHHQPVNVTGCSSYRKEPLEGDLAKDVG